MGKFKPARQKSDEAVAPKVKAGLPCIVFLVLGMILTMFLLYEVMKNAS
jgi:hypothetical protein